MHNSRRMLLSLRQATPGRMAEPMSTRGRFHITGPPALRILSQFRVAYVEHKTRDQRGREAADR